MNFEFIYEYFSDILFVDNNPHTIITYQVFKENGEVKKVSHREQVSLISSNRENIKRDVSLLVSNNSEKIEIDFFPKNIFKKIFKRKNKQLELELSKLSENEYLLVNSNTPTLKTNCKVEYLNNIDNNTIVIGKKNSSIFIRTIDDSNFEFYINPKDFKVIKLL